MTADGGVLLDGGATEGPAGGTVLDGDYDLVRWQRSPLSSSSCGADAISTDPTSRTIRVFGHGTYVEWAAVNQNPNADGGQQDFWYDTTVSATGHTIAFVSYDCGGIPTKSYGYTATGDELVFFNFTGGEDGNGTLFSIDSYRRTCAR